MKKASVCVAAAIACALTVSVGSASAAQDAGSDLTPSAGAGPAADIASVQVTPRTGATLPVTSPIAGVIVSILVEHAGSGPDPGVYGFRVLSGVSPFFSTTGAPPGLPDFVWPANDPPGFRVFAAIGPQGEAKGIPIGVGDRVGVSRFTGTGQSARMWSGSGGLPGGAAGASMRTSGDAHNTGTANYSNSSADTELLLQYRVEADVDGDSYGDETQDACPGTAGTNGGCAPIATPAKTTPATPAKKCKKKRKKKSAAAAKKKGCKKKKK